MVLCWLGFQRPRMRHISFVLLLIASVHCNTAQSLEFVDEYANEIAYSSVPSFCTKSSEHLHQIRAPIDDKDEYDVLYFTKFIAFFSVPLLLICCSITRSFLVRMFCGFSVRIRFLFVPRDRLLQEIDFALNRNAPRQSASDPNGGLIDALNLENEN
jgi:hypothetical protein